MRRETGFTLVVLLAVMAIIGILAGVVAGSISGLGASGQNAQIQSDTRNLETAADRFYNDSFPQTYPVVNPDTNNDGELDGLDSPHLPAGDVNVRLIDFDARLPQDPIKTFAPDFIKDIPNSAALVSYRVVTTTGDVFPAADGAPLILPSNSGLNVAANDTETGATSTITFSLIMSKNRAAVELLKTQIPAGYIVGGQSLPAGAEVGKLDVFFDVDNPWKPGHILKVSAPVLATGRANKWEVSPNYAAAVSEANGNVVSTVKGALQADGITRDPGPTLTHKLEISPATTDTPGTIILEIDRSQGSLVEHNESRETWVLKIFSHPDENILNDPLITNPKQPAVYRWISEEHSTIQVKDVFEPVAGRQALLIKGDPIAFPTPIPTSTPIPDTTGPIIGTIFPNNSGTGVAVGISIVATFSEKVTASTVNGTTFKIEDNLTNPVAGVVTVAGNGLSATFNPAVDLANGTTYTVTLTSGITDLALNALTPFTSIFTTEVVAAPALAVSTSSLDFGTGLTNLTFDITNTGGGNLTWTVSDDQTWLSAAPSSGSTTSETDTITVTANRSSLAAANYSATITVASNGGTETVSVAMEVLASPVLAVSTSALDFGTGLTSLTFDITNPGGGNLTWNITDNDSAGFLGTAPISGSTTSETDTITVTVNRSSLAAANYSATITVASNVGNATVSVVMEVEAPPTLTVSTSALDFGTGLTNLTFDITNTGGGSVTWTVSDDQTWLAAAPSSGSTTSDTDTITVTANRSSLAAANYSATITVLSNGGNATVSVAMEVQAAQPAGTFLLEWGTSGSAFGQFDSPREVAVDNSGNVYVVDRSNHRIQKFDASGNFVMGWGSEGTGPGQFFRPEHADIDSAGNIYVADKGNNRIQKFTSNGVFVTMWGTFGTGNGQFNNPQGVAVDGAGNVYVADTNNDRIQKFDSSGVFITKWVSDVAYDIAAASDGSIYVANRDDDIVQKFTSSGALVLIIGGISGADPGQFRLPSGVAVDAAGNVYIADRGNDRIQKFTSAGVFLAEWGIFGTGDGEFNTPQGVAVDAAGNVYVADTKNDRIQKFSSGE